MANNKSAYSRYQIIDSCLTDKQHPYPTKDYIRERIREQLGFPISGSMFDKDFEAMRYDSGLKFNAPICYSKKYKGYYYSDPNFSIRKLSLSEDEWEVLRNVGAMVRQMYPIGPLQKFDEVIKKIDRICGCALDVETSDDLQFTFKVESRMRPDQEEWVNSLYKQTQSRNELSWTSDTGLIRNFHPHLVQEKNKEWYVIGWCPETFSWKEFKWSDCPELKQTGNKFSRKNYLPQAS